MYPCALEKGLSGIAANIPMLASHWINKKQWKLLDGYYRKMAGKSS